MSNFPNLFKNQALFSIENKIAKIKISIPLTKLVDKNIDMVNLNDDQPKLLFGPEVDGKP